MRESSDGKCFFKRQGMRFGKHNRKRFSMDRLDRKTVRRDRHSDETYIDAAGLQRVNLLNSRQVLQIKFYAGVELAKGKDNGRNHRLSCRGDKADAEVSYFSGTDLSSSQFDIRNALQKLLTVGQDGLASGCKPNASSIAFKEEDTQVGFQILNLEGKR